MLKIIMSVMVAITLSACAAQQESPKTVKQEKSEEVIQAMPDWVKNPPTGEGYVFGIGSGVSAISSYARERAIHDAILDLARQQDSEMTSKQREYISETGDETHRKANSTSDRASTMTIKRMVGAFSVIKTEFYSMPNGNFKVYALVKCELGNGDTVDTNKAATDTVTEQKAKEAHQNEDPDASKQPENDPPAAQPQVSSDDSPDTGHLVPHKNKYQVISGPVNNEPPPPVADPLPPVKRLAL
jgi:hypothetical protein